MRNALLLLISAVFVFNFQKIGSAQNDVPIHPSLIGKIEFKGISPPLRDLPAVTAEEFAAMKEKALKRAANKKIEPRLYPYAETALPKGPDAAWQKTMGESSGSKAPIYNFEGQTTTSFPPDCNGTAGPNHYMQTVNTTYAIYSKTGSLLAGPTNMNLLFGSVPGATCNDGDPLIQYDEQAGRWLAVEFSLCGSNDLMLIAVSTTNDPTGTWYQYSFDVADTPDYEKIGVWQDGYYMGTNTSSGNDIYVFERSKMLVGQTAQMVAFDNSWRPGTGFLCVPPLDNDGVAAPAGSPGMFIAFNDDAVAGGSDQLWIYQLAVNWITPSASTFTRTQQLNVTPFDSQFTPSWDDITQPNSQKLDGVPQVIMNAPQYRNFGAYQTIVCCHTVDVDATNHAGIRWYELRKTPPATTWTIRQQSTFAPDIHSRWMGSIMLNGSGKIALGYSISSSTIYPGIRYCGQSATAYGGATGVLDIPEEIIHNGTVAQTSYNRWGDYSLMSVDPSDDQTFWFSSEYVKTGGTTKGSKIASFKFGNAPAVATLPATSVTGTTATINGTVNPNGLATTYYFQWGTTTSYGTNTTTTSAGSGAVAVSVNANLTGLTGGTTYHYRLTATNSDGTSYGSDFTFTPGAAAVTTTAATFITLNSASSGGNVTTDGGSTVTARGVCWATTASPVITGNHTTDGSGIGVFTSSITGLSANTLYHVRAYATNSSGTYYGEDLTFTTLCGIISTFPWNEGFENAGLIPNCWTQEQVNSSGVNWTFITGSGNSHPAAAHTGTYNACLKDVTAADNKTRLITPPLNLTGVSGPTLTFWHTQAVWSPDQDQLAVYYKTSAAGTLTLLTTYTASVTAWTQRTISLPNASISYYIAFEGNAKYGYGVCIDDVQVLSSCTSTVPVSISIVASANPVCQGASVTFTATPANGGTAPAYQWKINGINAGTNSNSYTYIPVNGDVVICILTSNATCVSGNPATSNTVMMTVLFPLSITGLVNGVSCNGGSDGTIFTSTSGGLLPYSYLWSAGETTSALNYLMAGSYTVTATDATLATVNQTWYISEPTEVTCSVVISPVSCNGAADGAIMQSSTGGTPPYSYIWSNGSTTPGVSGLAPGQYFLTVSDAHNCTYMTFGYIMEPGSIALNANVLNASCPTCNDGSISLTAEGGTPPYTYLWSNGVTTINISGLNPGNYGVTVSDFHSCQSAGNWIVTAVLPSGFNITGSFIYNNTANTELDSLWVILKQNGVKVDSARTNLSGQYAFIGKTSNIYTIGGKSAMPWGGVNSTDAIKVERHFAELEPLTIPVRLISADVNNTNNINSTDAVKIKRRFVGLDNSFARGDWVFAKPTGGDTVIVAGTNVVQNFQGLCVGDVNGSYFPVTGDAATADVSLINESVIEVIRGEEFELPVRITKSEQISAISLTMGYPKDNLELLNIAISLGNVIYAAQNGQIRIAWSQIEPLNLTDGEALLTLKFRLSDEAPLGIPIALNIGNESELADGWSEPISNSMLSVSSVLPVKPTAVNEKSDLLTKVALYPNPATSKVWLEFELMLNADIMVEWFNVVGELINTVRFDGLSKGKQKMEMDVPGLASGVYTLKIAVNGTRSSTVYNKLVISK
ncbi:MAG: hypothetical protein NT004_06840 [Bacteroidetes bacterium]|nr:hypothetical protein [Bacteroidota bacterium]